MKTRLTAMLMVIMALSACSTASVKARSVGNVRGFMINCSGLTSRWEACYLKAQSVCSAHGYRVISKTTDVKEDPADGFLGYSPGEYSRTVIIACNPPPSA